MVFICTPNEVHKSIALAALAASKNVITEKPAMLSVDEIQEVMAAEAASGKLFFVHQNRRWDEDYLVMKELYDARSMGDVTHIESRIDGSRGIPGDWRRDPSRGGGMVLDWGVHLVDRLLLMVPAPVKTVYSRLSYSMGAPVEDGFMIYLTFAGGVEDVEPDAEPVVAGQGMTKTMAPRIIDYSKMLKVQDNVEVLPLPRLDTDVNDFYRNVLAVIEGTAPKAVTNESVVRCMRVLEAARKSHETNTVVDLSGIDTYIAH